MKCPKCGLFNPPTALRCDCGWDFSAGAMKASYLQSTAAPLDPLASLGERLAGQVLDSIVVVLAIGLCTIPSAVSGEVGGIVFVGGVVFALFYVFFADGFRNGQSYGKRIMKTAVVDANTGEPCTFGQSFLRNFLLSLLGPIDWLFILGSRRQRLGDKAAKTLVVRTERAVPSVVRSPSS